MRQITHDAAIAMQSRVPFRRSNTEVTVRNGVAELRLHGNAIARLETRRLLISLAGWPTTTTRERLNGLMRTLGIPYRVEQVQFEQRLRNWTNGKERPISEDEWFEVSRTAFLAEDSEAA